MTEARSPSIGARRWQSATSEYALMSSAVPNPAREVEKNLPESSSLRANARLCMRISSLPTAVPRKDASASRLSSEATSAAVVGAPPSSAASFSTSSRVRSPSYVSTSDAPCACSARAMAVAMLHRFATPKTHADLPVSSAMLVLLGSRGESLADRFPIDDVPPRVQIVGPFVLVFQIIGVFPDVVAHDRFESVRHGVVLVGSTRHRELAIARADEPDPTAAELLDPGVSELFLERFEVPEARGKRVRKRAGRLLRAAGRHDGPKHRMIDVTSAVVADRGADVFGDRAEIAKQRFGGLARKLWVLLDGRIEVLHVRGVMLVVVQRHCLRVDRGLQRVVRIGERRDFKCHGLILRKVALSRRGDTPFVRARPISSEASLPTRSGGVCAW